MLTASPVSKADKLANDVKSSSPVSARSIIWESNQTSIVNKQAHPHRQLSINNGDWLTTPG